MVKGCGICSIQVIQYSSKNFTAEQAEDAENLGVKSREQPRFLLGALGILGG
jgi:hypothetical protein